MMLLLTGASGYIGSVVTEKLRAAGHRVLALARSDASARKLEHLGAEPVRGDLRDRAPIERAARRADASIHLAMESSADAPALDRNAVDAILAGASGKPFVYTSGIWVLGNTGGRVADETAPLNPAAIVEWRPAHEQLALGGGGIVIRPAMVYGRGGGFVGGFAASPKVVGTGENRWPFVHVDDLADLYVLALHARPGSLYFAASGPSIPVAEVARHAARGAQVEFIPVEEARETMGPMADALTMDQMVSARKAMEELGWAPKEKSVLGGGA